MAQKLIRRWIAFIIASSFSLGPAIASANDFPTEARAEYIIACMSGTEDKVRTLYQCSCAIDIIAANLAYEKFVAAETVLRMQKMNGEKGSLFRESDSFRETVKTLKNAEAKATQECF